MRQPIHTDANGNKWYRPDCSQPGITVLGCWSNSCNQFTAPTAWRVGAKLPHIENPMLRPLQRDGWVCVAWTWMPSLPANVVRDLYATQRFRSAEDQLTTRAC